MAHTRSAWLITLPLAFVLLAGCGDDGESASSPQSPPLKVMSFNILCSFCGIGEFDPWLQRLPHIGDVFARHDPDLIGTQELTPLPGEVDQVLAQAPGYAAVYFGAGTPNLYPDAMILYRTARFDLLEQGAYWLSPTPDTPFTIGFADVQLPRLVAWARLRDKANRDREIYFATTHFDNNSPSQEKSAPLFQARTAPFAATLPVIAVGDFNSRPNSTAYGILTGDASHGVVFQNVYDLTPPRIVTNQTPAPAFDAANRIDHIFVAGSGVRWSATDWVVDLTVYGPRNRYPSDHFAIAAELTYGP